MNGKSDMGLGNLMWRGLSVGGWGDKLRGGDIVNGKSDMGLGNLMW